MKVRESVQKGKHAKRGRGITWIISLHSLGGAMKLHEDIRDTGLVRATAERSHKIPVQYLNVKNNDTKGFI